MPSTRDPMSVYYDGYVQELMLRAARVSRQRRSVRAWIASPRGEYRQPDRGGRTRHERAFTRSAYYLVFKNAGEGGESGWSLRLSWDENDDALRSSSRGRLARSVLIRLYPAGEARVHGPRWVGTANQSLPGDRIDD